MDHPYRSQPKHSFWAKSAARDYSSTHLLATDTPLIRQGEKLVSAGSCFAANMVPYLEASGIHYVRTESPNPIFNGIDEDNFGYSKFSARFGNIYTPRQLLQLVKRATGELHPAEDRWATQSGIVDPFRPGLKFRARTDHEFEALRDQHFRKTLEAFSQADVFVFTLGLTETWLARADGMAYPACPGTIAGDFDPDRHEFRNLDVNETSSDLLGAIESIRSINPRVRFILTVSPVPLVATATSQHVIVASTYSKSVLRVAAEEAARRCSDVVYFPSYEIITGSQAPDDFFEPDRRNVSAIGVAAVMSAFLEHCENGAATSTEPASQTDAAALLSAQIIDAECEEMWMEH